MAEIIIQLQKKQREFWSTVKKTPVVFYGGSKGGGKSYGLRNILLILISEHPKSRALLIRKTYDELVSNHIEQFFKENPELIKFYNRGDKILQLPNGSSLRFRHLQYPQDVYNYQGQEFDYIGIDEATQHTKETFTILRSSNRTTNPKIKPRFILTGNPGGIGHGWVRKLFIVKDFEPNENPDDYAFVPAKVYDNAAIMDNDPDYIKRLESLPEDLRRAYLDGDWDIFQGQFFREWNREIHVIKPFEIYPSWKRYISIDYGFSAPSSVHWYAVDYQGRVICYRELYKAELTFRQLGETILKMTAEAELIKGINYNERKNIEFITYDPSIQAKRGETGQSGLDLLKEGLGNEISGVLLPANNNRKYGWGVMREYLLKKPDAFGGQTAGIVWFDTCINAIRTIPEMIYDAVRLEDLDSDLEDHCLTGDTKIDTTIGQIKIKNLVGITGQIYTLDGAKEYTKVWKTGHKKVYKIIFSNGKSIKATSNHRFLTQRGWVMLKDLQRFDVVIQLDIYNKLYLNVCQKLFQLPFKNLMAKGIIFAGSIFKETVKGFIWRFGNIITEKLKKVFAFITLTKIKAIMKLKILNYCPDTNIYQFTLIPQKLKKGQENQLEKLYYPLQNGINQQLEKNGILNTLNKVGKKEFGLKKYVRYAVNCIKRRCLLILNIAVSIVELQPCGEEDVYNLSVPFIEHYTVEGGIITHNCADETRYLLTSLKLRPTDPERKIREEPDWSQRHWQAKMKKIKAKYKNSLIRI